MTARDDAAGAERVEAIAKLIGRRSMDASRSAAKRIIAADPATAELAAAREQLAEAKAVLREIGSFDDMPAGADPTKLYPGQDEPHSALKARLALASADAGGV